MKNTFINKFLITVLTALCLITVCGCTPSETAHEHVMKYRAAVPSTCTEAGVAEHWECKDCKKLYTDEAGAHETKKADLALPLADHDFSIVRKGSGQHWFVCSVCGDSSEKEAHSYTAITENREASYTHEGYKKGNICLACGDSTDGGEIIPKTTLFTSMTHGGVNYCEYLPAAARARGEKLPLVLFLSGSGERGVDNEIQLKNAVLKVVAKEKDNSFMNSLVLVPQCPDEPAMWVDHPWDGGNYKLSEVAESDIMKKVVSLVEYYSAFDYVDSSKIYVIGISMGGLGAWDLLARHSDLFAAGVPICGAGPIDAVDVLKNVPVYAFHGKKDTSVPFEISTPKMVEAIKAAGGSKIEYVELDDGHMIWDTAIEYNGLETWLFSQSK